MNSKRKFSEVDSGSTPGGAHRPKRISNRSRRNPDPSDDQNDLLSRVKARSVNSLKSRVRAIERLFDSGKDLPATVKNDLERELAHHKQKIAGLVEEKRRKTMIKKYHMVRFFGKFFFPYGRSISASHQTISVHLFT